MTDVCIIRTFLSTAKRSHVDRRTRDTFLSSGWTGVATWRWIANDDNCGICRMPFDASCPDCKIPGDDCPLGIGDIYSSAIFYESELYDGYLSIFSVFLTLVCVKSIKKKKRIYSENIEKTSYLRCFFRNIFICTFIELSNIFIISLKMIIFKKRKIRKEKEN